MIVPYRGYATKDGFIIIAAGNDKLFVALSKVLGHPEWATDPRFQTNPDRVNNQTVLYRWIEDIVRERTSREWHDLLDTAAIPNAPMQTIADVLAHPQTKALGMLQASPEGDITLLGLPLSFDGSRPAFRKSPPALGAHTQEIFGDADQPAASRNRSSSTI
jgi:crotonobetainyl-CoA:carnitine CoA-transferase CaiB-like acyl-CoA transferase